LPARLREAGVTPLISLDCGFLSVSALGQGDVA
jgi:hypothetical protein